MSEDKKTIGLTDKSREALRRLMEQRWFPEEIDVAMFAMALAIERHVTAGSIKGADTKWNIGSFDPDIRNLIRSLYPENETPYRTLEFLINEGLGILDEQVRIKGEGAVRDVLAVAAPAAE